MSSGALGVAVIAALLACKRGQDGAPAPATSSAAQTTEPSPPPSASAPRVPLGAESPELAFAQLKRGALERDYRAFFRVLHVESQNMMLTGQLVGAGITLAPIGTKPNPNKKAELDAILKKHGVEDDGAPVAPGPPEQMMAAVGKKLEKVKDRPGLFHDLMIFLEDNSLHHERVTAMELQGLTRQGDHNATGTAVVTHQNGKKKKQPLEFRREDGRWTVFITKWR